MRKTLIKQWCEQARGAIRGKPGALALTKLVSLALSIFEFILLDEGSDRTPAPRREPGGEGKPDA